MINRRHLVVIALIAFPAGAVPTFAQEKTQPPAKKQADTPLKYEAEEGNPKDKQAEKRRDYAVLESVLNDLASPKNPENREYIENNGPGREIVIADMIRGGESAFAERLGDKSWDVAGKDERNIPADIQEDFKRRRVEPARTLADFKPANPNILVLDLDKFFDEMDDPVFAFVTKNPKAWGYVFAYPPAYSKDGNSVVVFLDGGPNGSHGLDWTYMLTKKGKKWEVQWRHLHIYE